MTGVSERRSLFSPDRQTDTHTDRPNYCNPRSRMRRRLINTVTMKALYLPNETVLSKSVSWKPRKSSEEQAGMSNLSHKHEKKPGDL